jgi:hypothetical protein
MSIESLLEEIEAFEDQAARDKMRETVKSILDLHAAGLARMMEIARAQDPKGDAIVDAFASDHLIRNLLLLHGLHPVGIEARVREALARDGADLRAMGGVVDLTSVSDEGGLTFHVRRSRASESQLSQKLDKIVEACAPDASSIEITWDVEKAIDTSSLVQLRMKAPKPLDAGVSNADTCEMCGLALGTRHEHVVDPVKRELRCSCTACAILFSADGAKWKRVPHQAIALTDFQMTDAEWESLSIPIGMAFFSTSSVTGNITGLYPGPAGAIESQLPLDAWARVVSANPVLHTFVPDTEALLVNRVRESRAYYRVSIDQCYELVGRFRRHWRGFTGGQEVWNEVGAFFGALTGPVSRGAHA